MILEAKKATFAYRCPTCGGVPTAIASLFSLSGDRFKLKCTCGGSELVIDKLPENKFRLVVPCVACPHAHTYEISNEVMFNSDIFIIPCSICGLDIFFLGKEELVSKEIKRSNEEIAQLLGDYALSSINSDADENKLSNPAILDIVTFVIEDMKAEGVIHCGCKNNDGDYTCEITDDGVIIKCTKCGYFATVPIDNTIAAEDFLNANELTLKRPRHRRK